MTDADALARLASGLLTATTSQRFFAAPERLLAAMQGSIR